MMTQTHASSFFCTNHALNEGECWIRISVQHVIPSHSRKYHSGNGDIVRTLCYILCSHKVILYGSMHITSRSPHVYKPQCFRSEYTVVLPRTLLASTVVLEYLVSLLLRIPSMLRNRLWALDALHHCICALEAACNV